MKRIIKSAFSMGTGLLFLLILMAPPAQAIEFGARGFWWFPTLKADLRVNTDSTTGTEINMKDTLGIEDKSTYSVEAYVGTKNHHLNVMFTPFDYSASKILYTSVIFNGQTYAANSSVDSKLRMSMFDLQYQYDLLNFENILAGFSIGLIGQIKYLDGEAKLTSSLTGEQKQSFNIPIPMVGLGTHIGLIANLLEARAKATGMGYSGSYFIDASADISVTPFPFVDIHGGYRYMKLKIDNVSNVYGNMDFYGPFVGLTIGF
jgi:hypothetical protein